MTAAQKQLTPTALLISACALVVSGGATYDCMGGVDPWGGVVLYWFGPILWITAIVIWQVFAPKTGFVHVLVGSIFLVLSYVYAWLEAVGGCIS